MNIDSSRTPFSRYGSYFTYSSIAAQQGRSARRVLRSVHGGITQRVLFQIELFADDNVLENVVETVTPAVVRLDVAEGNLELCIPEAKIVRLRTRGVGVRLHKEYIGPYETVFPVVTEADQRWQINTLSQRMQYMLTTLHGYLTVDAPWDGDVKVDRAIFTFQPNENGIVEIALEEFDLSWQPRQYKEPFESCVRRVEEEYQAWLATVPDVPEELSEGRELAAYLNWSAIVASEGHLTRPSMYMSKNWMTNVWSWDHCFNAMALIYQQPALAWDQFMVHFDQQHPLGAFPDLVNDKELIWNFCKPPVHGWTLKWMMERTSFINDQRLQEIYEPLGRWTNWWLTYRDDDHDGLPQYNHGNDSGWDNSTIFRYGMPVESPDLAAFLVLQMEVLAEIAQRIGKNNEGASWQQLADTLLQRMLAHFWCGDHFVALRSGSHEVCESESLILYLPLLLGKRLPQEIRVALIEGLRREQRFLTAFGPATESPSSPWYISDGYWRGPIWAPSTMIIVEGLTACGELEMAREISRSFCTMCARYGMAENFDALTGKGLRDKAYTWTSSVFLVLAHEYLLT